MNLIIIIMALILISYDLKETPKDIHSNVKKSMKSDYKYSDKSPQKSYQLPNTCLLKDGITPKQAVEDLKAVVEKYDGTLERYIACECNKYTINDLTE